MKPAASNRVAENGTFSTISADSGRSAGRPGPPGSNHCRGLKKIGHPKPAKRISLPSAVNSVCGFGESRGAVPLGATSLSSHCLPRIRKTILCACICTERRAWSSSARGLPTTGSRPCRPATCQTNVRASHPARANAARYARGRLSGGRGIGRRGRCRPPGEWRAGAAV